MSKDGSVRFQCPKCLAFVVFSYGQTLADIMRWQYDHWHALALETSPERGCYGVDLKVANVQNE